MIQPTIEVRTRSLLTAIWKRASSWSVGAARTSPQWASPEWHLTARIGDQMAGSLTLITRTIVASGEPVAIAGVGNVLTRPDYRRIGVASAMLEAAADLMRGKLGAEFGVLMCRHEVAPLYEKNGWRRVEGPTHFHRPGGIVICPDDTMTLKLTAREWPLGPIDLCGPPW